MEFEVLTISLRPLLQKDMIPPSKKAWMVLQHEVNSKTVFESEAYLLGG